MVAAAVVTFLAAWGAFLVPLVYANTASTEPLTVLIPTFANKFSSDYGLQSAAGLLAVLPPVLLVVLLQRHLLSGLLKLVAATALWFGFDQLMPYLLMAAFLGGLLTILVLRLRSRPLPAFAENWSWMRRLHAANEGVPYGIALAFAALLVLPDTTIWHAAIGI